MCIHESVDKTDEHDILVCWDCSREFARVPMDTDIIMVPMGTQRALLVPSNPPGNIWDMSTWPDVAFAVTFEDGQVRVQPVYPCRECGYAERCVQEGEQCHS